MIESFLLGGDLPVHRLGFDATLLCRKPGNFGPTELSAEDLATPLR
jgi:hypothetical protein